MGRNHGSCRGRRGHPPHFCPSVDLARPAHYGSVRARIAQNAYIVARGAYFLSGPAFAAWPSKTPGSFHANSVAHRSVRRSGDRLCHLGDLSVMEADAGSERMQEIAAAVREGAQAYLQAPIHHHRRRRRRDLPDRRLFPRLAGRRRLCGRRHPVRRCRLHRHERLGARQCAHRAGRDRLARRRPRTRLPRRRHHRACWSPASRCSASRSISASSPARCIWRRTTAR